MHYINSFKGEDSTLKKLAMMQQLYKQCQSEDELRYLVRSFSKNGLRIGLSKKSIEKCLLEYFESFSDRSVAQTLL